jgi:hypothetical protein
MNCDVRLIIRPEEARKENREAENINLRMGCEVLKGKERQAVLFSEERLPSSGMG